MKATAAEICEWYGVDRRTLTNWLNEDPPCPSVMRKKVREFDTVAVDAWREARALRRAQEKWERERPSNIDDVKAARDRRTIDEARLIALQVAEAEGRVIPIDVHEDRVRALCEPLAARLKSLTKYMGDVQLAQTDVEAATVLDKIGDDLLRALMGTADEIEDGPDDSSDAADAA